MNIIYTNSNESLLLASHSPLGIIRRSSPPPPDDVSIVRGRFGPIGISLEAISLPTTINSTCDLKILRRQDAVRRRTNTKRYSRDIPYLESYEAHVSMCRIRRKLLVPLILKSPLPVCVIAFHFQISLNPVEPAKNRNRLQWKTFKALTLR